MSPAALYQAPVDRALLERLAGAFGVHHCPVFFRADDIGRDLDRALALVEIFARFKVPLALAVVPDWPRAEDWRRLREAAAARPGLFCWHQHGLAHVNHEPEGRKCEFGPARARELLERDLARGRDRLENLLGAEFFPVFTPPWNRCDARTLDLLVELNYRAVSRWVGAEPPPPDGLPDLAVNVDLHTLRQDTATECARRLIRDWDRAVDSGRLGIMLHHPVMNDHAFVFLEQLLAMLIAQGVRFSSFPEMLAGLTAS